MERMIGSAARLRLQHLHVIIIATILRLERARPGVLLIEDPMDEIPSGLEPLSRFRHRSPLTYERYTYSEPGHPPIIIEQVLAIARETLPEEI